MGNMRWCACQSSNFNDRYMEDGRIWHMAYRVDSSSPLIPSHSGNIAVRFRWTKKSRTFFLLQLDTSSELVFVLLTVGWSKITASSLLSVIALFSTLETSFSRHLIDLPRLTSPLFSSLDSISVAIEFPCRAVRCSSRTAVRRNRYTASSQECS